MKRLTATVFIFLFLVLFPEAFADTVYLKNGKQISGIITRENQDSLELTIDIGAVKFYNSQIDHIVRSTHEDALAVMQKWEAERREKEKAESLKRAKARYIQKTRTAAGRQAEGDGSTARDEKEGSPVGADSRKGPVVIKAERFGDHLIVNALINGEVKARLLVDTGATYVNLTMDKANERSNLRIRKYDIADGQAQVADSSRVDVKVFQLKSLSVGGAEAKNVPAVAILKDVRYPGGSDGLLGMSYLKLFKFEIDLSGGRLILQGPQE